MRSLLIMVSVAALAGCSDGGKKKTNDPCANNTDCADNICHSGICVSSNALTNGSKCGGNGECKSLSCVGGTCAPGAVALGGTCLFSEECGTAVPCTGGKCGGGGSPDGGAGVQCESPSITGCTYSWSGCSDGKQYTATCSQADGNCTCLPDAKCTGMRFVEGCLASLAATVAACCKFPIAPIN